MKRKILFISIAIISIVVLSLVATMIIHEIQKNRIPDAKYDPNEIELIEISHGLMLGGIDSVYLDTQDDIEFFMSRLKMLKEYRTYERRDIERLPTDYTFKYTFKDGSVSEHHYVLYPATIRDPFWEIFQLESVIRQTNKVFSLDSLNLSAVKIRYWDYNDVIKEVVLTDREDIEYFLYIAREDAIINPEYVPYRNCSISFWNRVNDEYAIWSFVVTENTYKLDEICERYPEIAEIVELARQTDFK